jgi:hypothetical protein
MNTVGRQVGQLPLIIEPAGPLRVALSVGRAHRGSAGPNRKLADSPLGGVDSNHQYRVTRLSFRKKNLQGGVAFDFIASSVAIRRRLRAIIPLL